LQVALHVPAVNVSFWVVDALQLFNRRQAPVEVVGQPQVPAIIRCLLPGYVAATILLRPHQTRWRIGPGERSLLPLPLFPFLLLARGCLLRFPCGLLACGLISCFLLGLEPRIVNGLKLDTYNRLAVGLDFADLPDLIGAIFGRSGDHVLAGGDLRLGRAASSDAAHHFAV